MGKRTTMQIELLEKAKKFLWDGKSDRAEITKEYVCHAISRAASSLYDKYGWIVLIVERDLREYIGESLNYRSIDEWLEHNGYIDNLYENEKIQAYRLDFINALIAHIKKESE